MEGYFDRIDHPDKRFRALPTLRTTFLCATLRANSDGTMHSGGNSLFDYSRDGLESQYREGSVVKHLMVRGQAAQWFMSPFCTARHCLLCLRHSEVLRSASMIVRPHPAHITDCGLTEPMTMNGSSFSSA